ncbi:MAG: hypothetical protein ACM3Y9_14510 [Ignavibacteria bacterium]
MPVLPSGRRIEFSLDRFHALLRLMEPEQVRRIVDDMAHPDDLLFVLDAVHFGIDDGMPFFAGYVASDWKSGAAEWSGADREALAEWLTSPQARAAREKAMRYIKSLILDRPNVQYPYALAHEALATTVHPGSLLRQ